jgi:hypothetical protein
MPQTLISMRPAICIGLITAILTIGAIMPAQSQEPAPTPGIAELAHLDRLARFKPSAKVASISSYDRTGGNDDGFSGKYSFVRKEGDGLVIADLQGPGVISRVWTPTPTDEPIEFYFDGETEPRVKMKYRELFEGAKAPFLPPIASFGSGGFYSYLPMPYKNSCKVIIRAPRVQFYQINYATYPAGAQIESFSPASSELSGPMMERARKLLGMSGEDLSAEVAPEGAKLRVKKTDRPLPPGGTVVLFEAKRGGRIAGLRLRPAAAFRGKDRAIVLKIYWDGEARPAVVCPVGDFFGYAWGAPAMRSLLVGTNEDTNYLYFPMPFDKSARIELVSERKDGDPISVHSEVVSCDVPRRPDEGRFYAIWRRESPTPKGKPFNYVETEGRGHLVGVTLQAQGSIPGITPFFEGDDQAYIDGELTIHGTGSEDFFNGGWYDVPGRWEGRASYPLSGCLEYSRPQARSGGYRLFLTDAYAFHKSLKLDMEHAPEKNDFIADYTGVSYLYLQDFPTSTWTLPDVAARTVHDPERLVYTPGWYVPMHAFSLQNATLTKKNERIGSSEERYLSMHGEGEDVFGKHSISFLCAIPASGKYRVLLETINGPAQGIVQLYQNERAAGEPVDLYSTDRYKAKPSNMGILDLKEGPSQVFFKLMGKNPKSTSLGLDVVTFVLERVP